MPEKQRIKKVRLTFQVDLKLDDIITEEDLKRYYKNSILRVCKYLYKEEGFFWDKPLKLVSAKVS